MNIRPHYVNVVIHQMKKSFIYNIYYIFKSLRFKNKYSKLYKIKRIDINYINVKL